MRFGCCMGLATFLKPSTSRGILLKSLTFQEKLARVPVIMEALEKNGFDFVEAEVSLVSPEGDFEDFKSFKKEILPYSLKPEVFSAFIPPDLKVVGPKLEEKRLRRYLSESFHRVCDVGGKVIIWGSGSSRSYPNHYPKEDAYKQIEEFLHWATDFGAKNEIQLAIEPMNKGESNTINSLKEALTFADKINRQEIGVMLDLEHLMMEKEDLTVLESCRGKIFHVHISDRDRKCPGDGDYPFNSLFRKLKKIGYKERISLECNFQDFRVESKKGLDFIEDAWGKMG
jgi:D-psicose/D-tagatose/L-ribulose 3-epimerase